MLGDTALVGISDFAQSELGELVAIDIPTLNQTVSINEIFGVAEAVKTTSDLFMPLSGKVIEINAEVENDPILINSSPYEKGWIIKIQPTDLSELILLLDYQDYQETYAN